MVIGFWVNVYAYTIKNRNLECDISYHHLNIGFGIYASYFALFLNFFYNAYFGKAARLQKAAALKKKQDSENNNVSNGQVSSNSYGLRSRVGTSA